MRKTHATIFAFVVTTTFAAGAHAIAVPSYEIDANNALPAPDAVIPSNARLVAFSPTVGEGFLDFKRVHADGTEEELTTSVIETHDRTINLGAAFVVDLGTLSSAEGVSVLADGNVDFNFTVADATDDSAPSFDDDSATLTATEEVNRGFLTQSASFNLTGCLPHMTDDNSNGAILKVDVAVGTSTPVTALLPVHPTAECATPIAFSTPVADSVCVDAVAVDVAGNESAPLHVCADIPPQQGGCAQTEASAPAFALAAIALAAFRRRMTRSVA